MNSKATADGAVDLGDRSGTAFDDKVRWLREAAGERWGELQLNTLIQQVKVTDNREQAAKEVLGAYASWPADIIVNIPGHGEEILDAPNCLIGTVDHIVEQLQERHERWGISYITVHGGHIDTLAPVIDKLAGT